MFIFEIIDKTGRKISLPEKSWTHITTTHAEMTNYLEEIKKTLENPLKITLHGDLLHYYTYHKHRRHPEKYLRIIVKYKNGEGFIITSQFMKYIK